MEQYNRIWDGEREVSIRGLLFSVLKRWKALIAILLIGAVMGCVVSFVDMRQDKKAIMKEKIAKISEEKLDKEKIRLYADYVDLYEDQVKHDDNALMMKLDPESVWTGGAEWFITADEDVIDEICARINSALQRDGVLGEILARSGLDCSEEDFRGIIQFAAEKVIPDQQIVGEATESRMKYAQESVSVWYSDEEICGNILEALLELAEKTDRELASEYSASYMIRQIGDYMTYGYSEDVRTAQVNAVKTRQSYLDSVTKLKKDLSEDEKDYYSFYYKHSVEKEEEEATVGFSKLWPAAFAVGLAFVGALWFAILYILDGHLKDEEELGTMFGLKVLGVTEDGEKYGAIDAWLRKLENKRNLRAVDGEYLRAYLETMKLGKTAICLDSADEGQKKLAAELAKGNGQIAVAGDLAADSAAPTIAAESDGILLLVRAGKIAYTELRHIAELANGMKKKIFGVIVVR